MGETRCRRFASVEREPMELDDNLKQLMKQLGNAINESLSDSEPISEAISDIRGAGYDVFLILEATIGFHKRQPEASSGREGPSLRPGELVLSAQDAQFLRSLKISLRDLDEHPGSGS